MKHERTAYDVFSNEINPTEKTPMKSSAHSTDSARKIAWLLGIEADNLHARAALNAAAAQRGDYVSFSVNHETGALMQLDANE